MAKSTKRVLPTNVSLDADKQKEFNQKIQSVKGKKPTEKTQPGVVYLSHLPWGFEEKPLKDFFTQFGTIKQLRVSRSKKTGNSKGYAYIQFAHDEVAKIVAETMNNYLMFGKLLKCKHLLNPHPRTFKNANKTFKKPQGQQMAIAAHNKPKSPDAIVKSTKKAIEKYKKKTNKLAALGIQYQVECLDQVQLTKIKKEIFSDDESEVKGKETDKDKKLQKVSPGKKAQKEVSPSRKSKRQSLVPHTVDTPKGKMNVLVEDSSEEEISFKTPPFSIKSSKLSDSVKSKRKSEGNDLAEATQKKAKSSQAAIGENDQVRTRSRKTGVKTLKTTPMTLRRGPKRK